VLLSIIMVAQSVQSAASDTRAANEFADTETILYRLDVNTAGGITDVLDAIQAIGGPPSAPPSTAAQQPQTGLTTAANEPAGTHDRNAGPPSSASSRHGLSKSGTD
jgi:hypothetical protein